MSQRLPGQSIRDQKEKLTDNRLIPFYFGTASLWLLFAWESYKAHAHIPPQPTIVVCLAIIATGTTAIVFNRLFFRFRNLNRGESGELQVAEVLDELKSYGYRVIHSIARSGYDIDHVVVGPAGVFAVETKFRTGRGKIEFRNGEGLFVDGHPEEKDCLAQAIGNAAEVRKLIREHCGMAPWVNALLVFVGDWRVKDNWRDTNARVLTKDRVVNYILNFQPELKRSEIDLISSHLKRCTKS